MVTQLKNLFNYLNKHLPVVLGAVIVMIQALVDNGLLIVPPRPLALLNALLVASGLGILHVRSAK